jgi:hypothetical protein
MASRPKSQIASRRTRIVAARRGHSARYHTTKNHVGRAVAETGGEPWQHIARRQSTEGAAAAARGGEDRVLLGDVATRREGREHVSRQRGGSGDIGAVGRRRRHFDEILAARAEGKIAVHRDRADRIAGRQRAARVDLCVANRASAAQGATTVHRHGRIGHCTIGQQRAGIDGPRQHSGVGAGQSPGAAAGLLESTEALILRCRSDLRDVKASVVRAAETEGAVAGLINHIAGDVRAGLQLEHVGTTGEGEALARVTLSPDRPPVIVPLFMIVRSVPTMPVPPAPSAPSRPPAE